MAHHKSAQKRIRQIEKRRLHNRYFKKTTRNMIKKLRHSHSKPEAEAMLPGVVSLIDKLAKKGLFHKNKAANLKSKLSRFTAKIGEGGHHHHHKTRKTS